MKSTFRPSSFADLEGLRRLLAQAFGTAPNAPFIEPAMLSWKYWNARDDWSTPRSYVLERDGVIVAHAGIWPMTCRTGSDTIRGIQMIDWASARESPGAGLALVQRLATMFDFIYSIGGSEMTRKVLPTFGFVEFSREWKGLRPLRPLRQALTHQTRNWKLLPRFLRNSLLVIPRGFAAFKRWRAVEMKAADIQPDLYRARWADVCCSERPPAFFEYLLRCPVVPFRLYGMFDHDEAKGHLLISIVRGQARAAGVWLREASDEACTEAYFLVQRAASMVKQSYEVIVTGSTVQSANSAAHAGFRIRHGSPIYVLDKKGVLRGCGHFQFQLCDSDAAFMDSGKPSYWA
jgi:hypothetical protein